VKRKLTNEQASEIRRSAERGETCRQIGKRFGISPQFAHKIIKGQRYADVPGVVTKDLWSKRLTFTDDQVRFMRDSYREGKTVSEIIYMIGCGTPCMVRYIIFGRSYKHVAGAVKPEEKRNDRSLLNKKGSLSDSSVLDEEDVVQIKRMLLDGALQKDIALRFGVTPSCVGHIARGKTWVETCGDLKLPANRARGSRNYKAKLNEETVSYIKAHLKEGVSPLWLATAFKVNKAAVKAIARNLFWKHVKPHPSPPPLILSAERELPMRLRGKRLDGAFQAWNPAKPYAELANAMEAFAS
jgi:DNA invertase Pin-like site-specific DNA recombinase